MTTVNPPPLPNPQILKSSKPSTRVSTTVGVEIGYNSIHLVQLREAPDGAVFFDGSQIINFDPHLELQTSAFASVLRAALKDFCGSSRNVSIWAAPKQDRARLHHVQVPRVNHSRLSGAVYWALQREEPFLEKETVVDFAIEEDTPANQNLHITGVLAARDDIEALQQAFSQAGFPLTGIALPIFGLLHLVTRRPDLALEAPVLLCQMGLHATTVSVLFGRRLVFTRSIQVGLRSLAETLVKELDPAPDHIQAANLVLDLGREEEAPANVLWSREDVFGVLRPSLDRMVRQIERTLQYYQSNYNTDPIETIFVGGEIAGRGRLFDFISQELSGNVIEIDPFETQGLQATHSLPASSADRVSWGPAFGLALAGGGRTPNLARTYKDREKETKRRRIATGIFAFIFFLTAVAAIFYGWQQSQLRGLNAERDELNRSLQALGPRITETVIQTSLADVQALQERRRAAAKRYEGLALLSEVTRLTPNHISLLAITAEMGSPIQSDEEAAGQSVLLEGLVEGERTSLETSLAIYIARLDQSPLFQAVDVDSTELLETGEGLRLSFNLKLQTVKESSKTLAKK